MPRYLIFDNAYSAEIKIFKVLLLYSSVVFGLSCVMVLASQ